MKIRGLDNREYSWYLVGYEPDASETKPRSELHLRIRKVLKELFPMQKLLEETPLPGTGKPGLYADFYLPQLKLMVEAHGRQHFEYVHHFHGDFGGFIKSKKRDANKSEWCRINKISLAVLSYAENEDEWRQQVEQACYGGRTS